MIVSLCIVLEVLRSLLYTPPFFAGAFKKTLRTALSYPLQNFTNQCYNVYMSPGHFSKLSKEEWQTFNHDMKVLTGMLYTISTWPLKPFIPSLRKKAGTDKKDYEPLYNPPMDK